MKRVVLGILSAVVLLILFVVLCTFVRRPYEKVLIERFGNLIDPGDKGTIAYNWYFKLPTDSLVRIDTRLHLKVLPFKEVNTNGREPINVQPFVVWRIVDALKFRKKAGGDDEQAEKIMQARIMGQLGQAIQNHRLDEFFNSADPKTEDTIHSIELDIAKQATNGTTDEPGLTDMGIEIADVGFSRISFPPSNTDEVYRRMVAELNEKARFYESEGKAKADTALAEGARKAAEIRSDALAKAGATRGEGDSVAASKIAEATGNAPEAVEFYQYWKSLEVLKSSLAKNTILVLTTDSPWLKNLFDALRNGPPPASGASPANIPAPPERK